MRAHKIVLVGALFAVACGGSGGHYPYTPPPQPMPGMSTPPLPDPTRIFVSRGVDRGLWGWAVRFDAEDNGRTPEIESVTPDPEQDEPYAVKVAYSETNGLNEMLDIRFQKKLKPATNYILVVTDTKNHFTYPFTTPTVYDHLEFMMRGPLNPWHSGGPISCWLTATKQTIMSYGWVGLRSKTSEDWGYLDIHDQRDNLLRTFVVDYSGLSGYNENFELQGLDVIGGEKITCWNH